MKKNKKNTNEILLSRSNKKKLERKYFLLLRLYKKKITVQ